MSAADTPGVIEPQRLYVAEEARQRLRIGGVTWRKLLRAGLPTIRLGRQVCVFSDDLLRLLQDQKEGPSS